MAPNSDVALGVLLVRVRVDGYLDFVEILSPKDNDCIITIA